MEGLDRKMDKRLVMSDKNKNKCKAKMLIRDGFLSTTIAILSSLDLFVIPKEVVRKKGGKLP